MTSKSRLELDAGLAETRDLLALTPKAASRRPRHIQEARAVGRACVVILTSHLEAFIYGLNVETVSEFNRRRVAEQNVPSSLKLLHSRAPIDELAGTGWDNRAAQLREFFSSDGWLWSESGQGRIEADRLLEWMTTPGPKQLVRYFRYWEIDNVFETITRSDRRRNDMWRLLKEMTERRNQVAHGDPSIAVTSEEVRSYLDVVRRFGDGADRLCARIVRRRTGPPRPW